MAGNRNNSSEASKSDLCLYFSLQEDQPAYKAGAFEGKYLNSNQEIINIEGQLTFKDRAGEELNESSHGKDKVAGKKDESFKITQKIQAVDWVVVPSSYSETLPM